MAEKGFGVKEVNLIGASGTPTITSPNNLNLNANNVAISTNVSIGGTLSVTGNVSVGGTLTYEDVTNIDSVGLITARSGLIASGISTFSETVNFTRSGTAIDITQGELEIGGGIIRRDGKLRLWFYDAKDSWYYAGNVSNGAIGEHKFKVVNTDKFIISNTGVNVSGICTATTFSGSGASLTNVPAADPTDSDIQVAYTVTANGSSAYRFAGNGVVSTADDPDIFLTRGVKYRFINNSGGSHPFQIRVSDGGSAYSTGVTNNGASSGNIDFAPTFDSPSKLVYQCTSHSGMVGNIYITGGEVGGKSALGNRNVIINGSMLISQRGSDFTGVNSSAYHLDRWYLYYQNSSAAFRIRHSGDGPDGFYQSYRVNVTTADTSIASNEEVKLIQKIEGFNLQRFAKGTSSAKAFALSFYVKCNKTGTYIVRFYDRDNGRDVSGSYVVSNSNWNRYTIIFPADTSGEFNFDANSSLEIMWWLVAGSAVQGGTLNTAWRSSTDPGSATGQVNFTDSTSNEWMLAGVQLETSLVTPFEHIQYAEELSNCQRYYVKDTMTREGSGYGVVTGALDSIVGIQVDFPVTMRSSPGITLLGTTYRTGGNANGNRESPSGFIWGRKQTGSGTFHGAAYATGGYEASAEL